MRRQPDCGPHTLSCRISNNNGSTTSPSHGNLEHKTSPEAATSPRKRETCLCQRESQSRKQRLPTRDGRKVPQGDEFLLAEHQNSTLCRHTGDIEITLLFVQKRPKRHFRERNPKKLGSKALSDGGIRADLDNMTNPPFPTRIQLNDGLNSCWTTWKELPTRTIRRSLHATPASVGRCKARENTPTSRSTTLETK